jgi:uncharacterized protein
MSQRHVHIAAPRCYAALLFLGLCALAAHARADTDRDLNFDQTGMVEMEIATVMLDPLSRTPLVLLRDPAKGDLVPIAIGIAEARAILLALHEAELPRPMTHDLLNDVITAAGAVLLAVYVDDLVDGTYLGALELRLPGREQPIRVDSRPSDALALALRAGASVFVAAPVVAAAQARDLVPLDEHQVATAVGVSVLALSDDLRESLDLPDRPGVLVREARGRAAEAGFSAGMMILQVNGRDVVSPLTFLELIGSSPSGTPIRFTVWEDGAEREITLVPAPAAGTGPRIRA